MNTPEPGHEPPSAPKHGAEPGSVDSAALPDGTYDVFVIDATEREHPDGAPASPASMHLDVTVTSGEHKGAVLEVVATGLRGSEIDLIGMPATLTVDGGQPTIRIDT